MPRPCACHRLWVKRIHHTRVSMSFGHSPAQPRDSAHLPSAHVPPFLKLGPERGVAEVVKKQVQLPVEGPLDRGGSASGAAAESLRGGGAQLGGLGSLPPFRFRL